MKQLPIWARPPEAGAYATNTGWFCKNNTMLVSHRGLKDKIDALTEALTAENDGIPPDNTPVNRADRIKEATKPSVKSLGDLDNGNAHNKPVEDNLDESEASDDMDTSLQKDNLTKIKGIGDKTQMSLNEAGIYTYEQLSNVTPEQIEELNISDSWVDQANLMAN